MYLMNNNFFYLVVLVLITTFSNAGSYQLKYRIECAKSNDLDLLKVINKIPELRTFMMPSGSRIYFSGDYFFTYPEADRRLNEIKALGFKDAFIRVFKYQKMLSKPVGNRYITKIVELEKKKGLKAEGKEAKLTTNVSEGFVSSVKKEVVPNNKDVVDENSTVDEAPIFKILIAKTMESDVTPDLVQLLTDEIVYSYLEGVKKYYAVGFYETSKHAERRKMSYEKYATQDPEVIGVYKGKIVSLKLAQELYKAFNSNSK